MAGCAGLQPVGSFSRQVTFRDGKEVQDTVAEAVASPQGTQQELGLHSWGEFGPALFVVLSDTAKGKVTFSHWEETAPQLDTHAAAVGQPGLVAVFRYSVPKAVSHYGVNYCCIRDAKSIGSPRVNYSGERGRQGPSPYLANSVNLRPFTETPGYHGTISIDPATGTVVRITIEAELDRSDPLSRAATAIEYGRVSIGDQSYFCPVHSLALSMEDGDLAGLNLSRSSDSSQSENPVWASPSAGGEKQPILLINETRFADYHRLGSTVRILTDTAGSGTSAAPESVAEPADANRPAIGTTPVSSAAPISTPAGPSDTSAAATSQPIAPPAPPAPAEPAIPEVSMSAASGVPDEPANTPQPDANGYSLKVTSRLVDVGLVAYDKKGHPGHRPQTGRR